MVSKHTKIINPMGMHMRPAQLFVGTITPYKSDVTIRYGDKTIVAKSIMNLMAACMKQGSEIEVICEGPDEQECLDKAVTLIESGLGE